MLMIWRGLGFLVPIIFFIGVLLTQSIAAAIWGNSVLDRDNLLMAISCFVAAIICYLIGSLFDRKKPKVYIDKETGQEFVVKKTHSFFFIPLKTWGFILPIIAIVLFITM